MRIFSDKSLSQKLERTEARTNADFVESRVKLSPEIGAEWIEVSGVYAMFDSIESPLTQTFGLGVFGEITDVELNEIEAFFKKHQAPIFHEVSPIADHSLIGLLNERGYQPCELTSVMFRPLDAENEITVSKNPNILTRIIADDEVGIWANTAASGWTAEMPEYADFMTQFCTVGASSKGSLPFIAEIDGVPIATGSMSIYDDVAMLGGASTIPENRNQGAQTALLSARLNYAREMKCAIAVMGALPGSQSQRNAEKNGFQIAYTRTKWQLKSEKA